MALYKGTERICPIISAPAREPNQYLTFSTTEGTNSVRLPNHLAGTKLEYSYDTINWTEWDFTALEFGEDVKLYLRGENDKLSDSNNQTILTFSASNVPVDCYGSVMSLLSHGESFNNIAIPTNYCFYGLFAQQYALRTAPELPAKFLREGCYQNMFFGCSNLINIPELEIRGLAGSCCLSMFQGCTSLTEATVMVSKMDYNNALRRMFSGCSRLNKVTCLTNEITHSDTTNSWLESVSATGTFVKKAGVTWQSGDSGIPTGWTVEEV